MSVTIYHNPRCSKSRQALQALCEAGVEPEVVEYLETPPSEVEFAALLDQLGVKAHDVIRNKEAIYKELRLSREMSDSVLIQHMLAHPQLIERPIVTCGNYAAVVRTPEAIKDAISHCQK